jgi:hypothetical protein
MAELYGIADQNADALAQKLNRHPEDVEVREVKHLAIDKGS